MNPVAKVSRAPTMPAAGKFVVIVLTDVKG